MRVEVESGGSLATMTLDLGERTWIRSGSLAACDPSLAAIAPASLLQRALMKLTKPRSKVWLMLEASKGGGRLLLGGLDPGESLKMDNAEGLFCRSESLLAWTGEAIEDPAQGAVLAGAQPAALVRLVGQGTAVFTLPGGARLLTLSHGQTMLIDPARLAAWEVSLSEKPDEIGLIQALGPGRALLRGAIPEARLAMVLPVKRRG